MRTILLLILLGISISISAQKKSNVYSEQTKNGYTILADNDEFCPISIEIKFKLTNLKSTEGNNKVFVIPARSKKHKITDLVIIKKNKDVRLGFKSIISLGNSNLTSFDEKFEYYLPFNKGESYMVWQGYNGSFSHKRKNALDFTMPIGTEIHSARDGIIIDVVQKYRRHCKEKKCAKYNNFILVYHPDGTFAVYNHIKKNGSVVKIGDEIKIGQLIGYSGNVGWSTGPHLHFEVFSQNFNKRKTIKTKFLIDNGKQSELLVAKTTYNRNY